MEERITLKKIAQMCDLAPTTVSSILHGRKTYCSEAKVQKVKDLVEKYHYQPSVGYSIMTGRTTNIVAVVFSQKRVTQHDMLQDFYMNLCTGLNERNYSMYTAILSTEWEGEKKELDALIERGCRIFIFIGTPRNYLDIRAYLRGRNLRTLGFNNQQEPNGVICDQVEAYLRYLDDLEKQKKSNIRIAISTDRLVRQFFPRLPEAKRDFYLSCCMNVPSVGYITGSSANHYFQLGYQQMREEYLKNTRIQAILFPTDYHALGAASALKDLNVPSGQVSLFGMDDCVATRFSGVSMTTTSFDVGLCVSFLMNQLVQQEEKGQVVLGTQIQYPR